ncbi:FAS1-like dehydratase domain-containing protein [Microbacterium sp. A94]|uniref:FAS1-like dehydratase domain-containing protein n=1 Tax=Microbacterium sp. A94 TaxID=3450717 RepID=UPI003F43D690
MSIQQESVSDWREKWAPMEGAVGTDFADAEIRWGIDIVEPATIRRYVEPLEIDSPIHHDGDVARSLGYDDIIAPATAVMSYTIPAMWAPGEPPLFVDAARDSQPVRSPIQNENSGPLPPVKGFFATDLEIDFVRPVTVGERMGRRGRKLIACDLKETSVGHGAFLQYESEIVSDRGDVVARMKSSIFVYDPIMRDRAAR